jgi:signal transduction histidine kinase
VRTLGERLRQIDQRRADRAIALGLSLLVAVFVIGYEDLLTSSAGGPPVGGEGLEGSPALNLLVALIATLSLLARRDHPLLTASLASGSVLALQLFLTTPLAFPPATIALIVVAYSAGAHADGWRSVAGLAITSGTFLAVSILETPEDILFPFFVFGVSPWVVGRVLRGQTRLARELAEKETRVRHLRELEEAGAAGRERTRVARELHDVLAHNLSVAVIQAAGARRTVARDPDAAVEAARLIARTGREALVELRQVFGPLRRGEGEALGGAGGLDDVEELIERARTAGLPARLRIEGQPVPLGSGAEAAAYRLIQEALTNAIKHAPGATTEVLLRYRPDAVSISITNEDDAERWRPTSVEGSGQGLIGMRERIELYGGEVEAGPREDGGFSVRATMPSELVGVVG